MPEPAVLANESWFNNRWRPAMAWLWFTVSACDFILFPVLNALAASSKMIPYSPWQPMTLQNGGIFHAAMGAVVGVTSWRRSDEKIAIYNADSPGSSMTTEKTTEKTSSTVSPKDATTDADKSSRAD